MQTLKTIDNIHIAYEVYGDDSAPVILLIMGLGKNSFQTTGGRLLFLGGYGGRHSCRVG